MSSRVPGARMRRRGRPVRRSVPGAEFDANDNRLSRVGLAGTETGTSDPLLFGGGDTNLYNYVLCDPVNLVDPSGLVRDVDLDMLDQARSGRSGLEAWEWWLYDAELPGWSGSGNPENWGNDSEGGNWNATGAYVASHGTRPEKVLYTSSLITASAATIGALGVGASGISSRVALHGAHHTFGALGRLPHLQVNVWRVGVRGSGRAMRIPLPKWIWRR